MKILLALLLALALSPAAFASEIVLAWDANSEPDIAGYRLRVGDEIIDCGNTLSRTIDLPPGRYLVSVSAYNLSLLESGPSAPLRLISGVVTIEASETMGIWQPLVSYPFVTDRPQWFYRAAIVIP